MTTTPNLGGAVDLGALNQKRSHKCTVPDGCGYTVNLPPDKKHETLQDCVAVAVIYAAQLIAESQLVAEQAQLLVNEARMVEPLSQRVNELTAQVATLITANQRFQDDLQTRDRELKLTRDVVHNMQSRPKESDGTSAAA